MKLNHMNLVTHDIEASQAFYERYFGFKKLFEEAGEVFLQDKDGFLLALGPIDEPIESPKWFHFGHCVDSLEEVKNIYSQMKLNGEKFAKKLGNTDRPFVPFYVFDPAGHRVEVSCFNI